MKITDYIRNLIGGEPPLSVIPSDPGPKLAPPKAAPAAPAPTKTPVLRSNPEAVRLLAEAKKASSQPPDPHADPWYTDTRRSEAAKQPSWLSAGAPRAWLNSHAGRPVRHVSAQLIRPDGSSQELPAPDYEPQPGVPGPRVIRGVL